MRCRNENIVNQIRVEYYALFREQAGCTQEALTTSASTVRALYEELQARHGFSVDANLLKVAINEEFADWSSSISDGDSIVFIPPVAGG